MKREVNFKCPWLITEEAPVEILRWLVGEKDHVEIDQDMLILLLGEGEFIVPSPVDGTIQSILAEPGDMIDPDQVLAVIASD